MRLFSQVAQDSELKVGRVIWVAGHSGPETAEDARTHFGIFSPGVTQFFPKGAIVNIHPWEYNEVAPMLGAALATKIPIIALHLTRPPVEIPDRKALGMASHMDAAKGAYVIRGYNQDRPQEGVVIIRGTSSTANLVKLLPRLNEGGPNVKVVSAGSWLLFQRQSEDYRGKTLSTEEMNDAMIITNGSLLQMHNWTASKVVADYSLSSDWDNRWRTGGSLEEVVEEAHLSEEWIWKGIKRFADERRDRLAHL
jgi:transketolase